ncbi:hypothetical protein [Spirosoma flavum]|uniref:hypothetical protein n=1 Tax=Spirosoma flavum TaxID=2048557 RepID=UPI0036D3E82B
MKKIIDESSDSQDEVLVRLQFGPGKDGIFPARVIARCQDAKETSELLGQEISGCPRPPGCG